MKFATVLGATSGQNSTTISPCDVFRTATSLSAARAEARATALRVQARRREKRGCFMPGTSARLSDAVTRKNRAVGREYFSRRNRLMSRQDDATQSKIRPPPRLAASG